MISVVAGSLTPTHCSAGAEAKANSCENKRKNDRDADKHLPWAAAHSFSPDCNPWKVIP